jgi:hypothetical protein
MLVLGSVCSKVDCSSSLRLRLLSARSSSPAILLLGTVLCGRARSGVPKMGLAREMPANLLGPDIIDSEGEVLLLRSRRPECSFVDSPMIASGWPETDALVAGDPRSLCLEAVSYRG